jgi:hypothetical protein
MAQKQILESIKYVNQRQLAEQKDFNQKMIKLKEQENNLKEQELKSRNRVDISLVEYEQMQQEIKTLKEINKRYENIYECLKVSEFLHRINEDTIEISSYQDYPRNKQNITITFELKDYK